MYDNEDGLEQTDDPSQQPEAPRRMIISITGRPSPYPHLQGVAVEAAVGAATADRRSPRRMAEAVPQAMVDLERPEDPAAGAHPDEADRNPMEAVGNLQPALATTGRTSATTVRHPASCAPKRPTRSTWGTGRPA